MNKDISGIKIILFDVDGVLTDGRIILSESDELKCFDARDGMGITIAKNSGFIVGIITGRNSRVVERRAKELKLDYTIQGSKDKLKDLDIILKKEELGYENVCYVGDDIIDIPVFRKVGFSATPNDAPDLVKSEATFISDKMSGRGAVREIIEYLLDSKGTLKQTINHMIKNNQW